MSNNYKEIFDELDQSLRVKNAQSHDPNWLIRIAGNKGKSLTERTGFDKSIQDSKLKLNEFALIHDHQFCLTRGFAMESSSKDILPDANLTAHELKIIAPMSSISQDIHSHFSQNLLLAKIDLIRVIMIGTTKDSNKLPFHVTAHYEFGNAYISGLISKNDLICLAFRYESMKYIKEVYQPDKATKSGSQVAAYHNLFTGKAKG